MKEVRSIWVLTLFPAFFDSFKELGVIGSVFRGERDFKIQLNPVNISNFSPKSFKGVDDAPYGGGPGMIMRAKELLEKNPNPTEEEIRGGISGNLCRCSGYVNIIKAIQYAANKINEQQKEAA